MCPETPYIFLLQVLRLPDLPQFQRLETWAFFAMFLTVPDLETLQVPPLPICVTLENCSV